MVAIVSGNQLGLGLGSLGILGVSGRPEGSQARTGSNQERAYVNVATGNLVLQDSDDQCMGRGGGYP